MQLARLGSSARAFAAGRPWSRMFPRLKRTCHTPAGHSFGVAHRRGSDGGPWGSLVGRVARKNEKVVYRWTRIEVWTKGNDDEE